MTQILATAPIPAVGHQAFAPIGEIEVLDDQQRLSQAEVLLVRSESVGAAEIAQAKQLKIIARTGSGLDNIDREAAERSGVPIVFAPASGAIPIAEGAFALLLAAAKRLRELQALVLQGQWAARYEIEGLDLHGSTIGIVGLGQIGREVARMAQTFGMAVSAFDPHVAPGSVEGVEMEPLLELAAKVEVLSLHCPLTEETRGMVDHTLIDALKPGAVLINTARGEVVAGNDVLLRGLGNGQLRAVALDVFEAEPPPLSNELLADRRVICTPHSIGLTRKWNERVFQSLADDVARFLRGEAPVNVADGSGP